MSQSTMSGSEKAAILLMALEKPSRNTIFRLLNDDETAKMRAKMAQLPMAEVPIENWIGVLEETWFIGMAELYFESGYPRVGIQFLNKVMDDKDSDDFVYMIGQSMKVVDTPPDKYVKEEEEHKLVQDPTLLHHEGLHYRNRVQKLIGFRAITVSNVIVWWLDREKEDAT